MGTEPAGVLEVGLFPLPDWSEVSGAARCADGSLPVEVSVAEAVGFGVVGGESLRWDGVDSVLEDWSCWVL